MNNNFIKIDRELNPAHVTGNQLKDFKLKKTGQDIAAHIGIEWIILECPRCKTQTKFNEIFTAMVVQPTDEAGGTHRDFHSICKCDNCDDVVYVKYFDYDFDPDWYMDIEFIYPNKPVTTNNEIASDPTASEL